METNVGREVAALLRMTVKQLRQKYAEVFGEETNGHNKTWLVKRIAACDAQWTPHAAKRSALVTTTFREQQQSPAVSTALYPKLR